MRTARRAGALLALVTLALASTAGGAAGIAGEGFGWRMRAPARRAAGAWKRMRAPARRAGAGALLALVMLVLAPAAGGAAGGAGEGVRSAGMPRGFEEVNFEHFRRSLTELWQRLTRGDPAELAAKLALELGSHHLARSPCPARFCVWAQGAWPACAAVRPARCVCARDAGARCPRARACRDRAPAADARAHTHSRWRTWPDDACLPPALRPMVNRVETGTLSAGPVASARPRGRTGSASAPCAAPLGTPPLAIDVCTTRSGGFDTTGL